jgi:hypothetical protein
MATEIALCRQRFPEHEWIIADMRTLSLNRPFQGILAWDSFFHLSPEHQRRMFAIFHAHACAGTALMFTSGPRHGEAIGSYQGERLYHASLAPEEYRGLLSSYGFALVSHQAEDPLCGLHTVWLARAVAFRLDPKPQAGGDAVARRDTHPASMSAHGSGRMAEPQQTTPKKDAWMNFYPWQHKHYCGIDLHARAMYVYILDQHSQYNLPQIGKRLANKSNREDVADHFPDPSVRKAIEVDVSLIDHYDQLLGEVELYLTRSAKAHDVQTFARLQSGLCRKVDNNSVLLTISGIFLAQAFQHMVWFGNFVTVGRELWLTTNDENRRVLCLALRRLRGAERLYGSGAHQARATV